MTPTSSRCNELSWGETNSGDLPIARTMAKPSGAREIINTLSIRQAVFRRLLARFVRRGLPAPGFRGSPDSLAALGDGPFPPITIWNNVPKLNTSICNGRRPCGLSRQQRWTDRFGIVATTIYRNHSRSLFTCLRSDNLGDSLSRLAVP
jgi:hypothetical protein